MELRREALPIATARRYVGYKHADKRGDRIASADGRHERRLDAMQREPNGRDKPSARGGNASG
ncbi:hypothetical protein [Alicyclobacillus sp. ALC3]|uniref:hypothetical protein n=1 Tax=Alicyclobacillus sp. ALC3 TaxID=2796143 RepID=UPI002378A7BD|nr:hypothetical protein [Alicyclobacillus sp. ALC3]WDL95199.1 hypothetical protein JC200_12275 [Alicyclobacillus sp. ALC3]